MAGVRLVPFFRRLSHLCRGSPADREARHGGKKRGGGALCCIGFPTSERITDRIQRERDLMDKAIVSPEFGVNPRRV